MDGRMNKDLDRELWFVFYRSLLAMAAVIKKVKIDKEETVKQ
jgi:hypothetical protein